MIGSETAPLTPKERQKLVRELDQMMSRFVRTRDKRCYTCGKRLLYAKRQAGHFIPREVMATRWSTQNVHVQCAKCNVELGGNLKVYAEKLKKDSPFAYEYLCRTYNEYKAGKLKAPSDLYMETLHGAFVAFLSELSSTQV